MGQSEVYPPSGELILERTWKETSSTHVETDERVFLRENKKGNIELVESFEKTNFLKSADSQTQEQVKLELTPSELVALLEGSKHKA